MRTSSTVRKHIQHTHVWIKFIVFLPHTKKQFTTTHTFNNKIKNKTLSWTHTRRAHSFILIAVRSYSSSAQMLVQQQFTHCLKKKYSGVTTNSQHTHHPSILITFIFTVRIIVQFNWKISIFFSDGCFHIWDLLVCSMYVCGYVCVWLVPFFERAGTDEDDCDGGIVEIRWNR